MEFHPVSAFHLKRDIIGRARRCVEAMRSAHVACIGMLVMRDICPLCNDHRRYGQSGRIIVLMPCAYPLYDGKNDDAKYDNKHDGDDETQYIKHCKHLSALLQRSNFRSDNLRSTYIVS